MASASYVPLQSLPERPPVVGELVQVRPRRWLVEEVMVSSEPGQSAVVRLACADDDAQGQALDIYWDHEPDRLILEEEGWANLAGRGFDPPRMFAAFLHTLRWNCVTATDPNLFQSPFQARAASALPPAVPRAWVAERVAGLESLLRQDPIRARTEFQKHLDGDLELVPLPDEEGRRRVELRGRVKHAGLLVAPRRPVRPQLVAGGRFVFTATGHLDLCFVVVV